MSNNALKKIIKEYVRQCIVEILMEQNIQQIVERTIKTTTNTNNVKQENIQQPRKTLQSSKVNKSDLVRKILGEEADKSPYGKILMDTARSDNPIISGIGEDEHDPERTELVSENVLDKLGINRDWSRLIG